MSLTASGRTRASWCWQQLKELFVASMAQWMSGSGNVSMDDVILAQVELLRAQINTRSGEKKKKKKKK